MKGKFVSLAKGHKAFTLIELLIVIAIMAILTVTFLPTLRGGQAGARNAARKAAANDIAIAIERIINGDTGSATLGTATVGQIPASAGGCLDFAAGLGADIRAVLGKTINTQLTNVTLCSASSGFFYKSFPGAGVPNNYIIVSQVELPVTNGNVSGAALALPIAADGSTVSGHFDTWANTLARTTGAATNPLWAVTK